MTANFQQSVNTYLALGLEGTRASDNPIQEVLPLGPGWIAGSGGVTVARFVWSTDGIALSNSTLLGNVPLGLVANEHQGLITTWLAGTSMISPQGIPQTVYDRGDFWVRNTYGATVYGYKVFANLSTGQITTAATASFLVDPLGTVTTMTASSATNQLTVTVTDGYIAPGMKVTGTFANGLVIPANVYIQSQYSGSAGSTGVYILSQTIGTGTSHAAILATNEEGAGGFTASDGDLLATNMYIETLTNGKIVVGQIVKGTGITAGTYIVAQVDGTPGGVGNFTLSASATTQTAIAITGTDWIETPWSVKSQEAVAIGELVKIGIAN